MAILQPKETAPDSARKFALLRELGNNPPLETFLVLLVCQLPATFRPVLVVGLPKNPSDAGVDDSVDSGGYCRFRGKFDAHSIHWRVGPEI